MDPQPSTSREDPGTLSLSPTKKRPRKALTISEKVMIGNAYKYVYHEKYEQLEEYEVLKKDECVNKVAEILGIAKRTVYDVLKEHKENKDAPPKPPKKPGPKLSFKEKFDEFTFSTIRRCVHQFFYRNEPPTITKILNVINDDPDLPNMSKETLRKVMKHINFAYTSRSRRSILIDRQDIITWRQHYLQQIREYRRQGRYIYYQDETWVNAGHSTNKTWVDKNITTTRQAFLDGLTTGLKNPPGKGKRLIISHIFGEEGFVEDALLIFEAKKGKEDYHDEMNAACFEEWFENILPKLKPNSLVVMDNAPYHSRKLETAPNMSWKKSRIIDWLSTNKNPFEENMVKATLLELVPSNQNYNKYAVNEMAARHGIIVLRLPPYHCELNPIELVWAQVKGHVARNNTTYKLEDVKNLFIEGINTVTPERWSNCVSHTIKEEHKMSGLDPLIDNVTDTFMINVTDTESESE